MDEFKPLIGLEIHQQLEARHKLFCKCSIVEQEEPKRTFLRRLRPTQSEIGEVDAAALFEFKKKQVIEYQAGEESSCLVEADEEPPHEINQTALESAQLIALSLGADLIDELHVMRKIVIDGSNTTGFQRTIMVALGGELNVVKRKVKVQAVCLEEDAARLIGKWEKGLRFNLDRLCIPIVEVALEPVEGSPQEIQEIAFSLGRLMRMTGRVARGLGTIRQDLNISLAGHGVVEIKGVQKLDLLPKVVEYEIKRQSALLQISKKLRNKNAKSEEISEPRDVTDLFKGSRNKVLNSVFQEKGAILSLRLPKFAGLLSHEPEPGIRLGKEMAELVRFYGLGGIFHSDEQPIKSITNEEISELINKMGMDKDDAFVILAGRVDQAQAAAFALADRARAAITGVPAETRSPTQEGTTRYSRPKPGAARMYPETDIPLMTLDPGLALKLGEQLPKSWEEQIQELEKNHGLSGKLSSQIIDSGYRVLLEKIAASTKISPSFIAATLTETLVSLDREGGDLSKLEDNLLEEVFKKSSLGHMSKEAIPEVLRELSLGNYQNVDEVVKKLGLKSFSDQDVRKLVSTLVKENRVLILEKGERSIGQLMGKVMHVVRGKVDGKIVNKLLEEEIKVIIEDNKIDN